MRRGVLGPPLPLQRAAQHQPRVVLHRAELQHGAQLGLGLAQPRGVVVGAGQQQTRRDLLRRLLDETTQNAGRRQVFLGVEEHLCAIPPIGLGAELVVGVVHLPSTSGTRPAAYTLVNIQ